MPPDMLPQIDIVSSAMRQQILAGKDVNLALLLLPGSIPDNPDNERSKYDKKHHSRSNEMTFPEFITAFGVYKRVMCDAFPSRHDELVQYESVISRLYMTYGQKAFNEYHRSFSSKSWAFIDRCNVKLDWGVRDRDIYDSVTAGRRPNSCYHCNSIEHPSHRYDVVQSAHSYARDKPFQSPAFKGRKQVCNNYNTKGCSFPQCSRAHICSHCHGTHTMKDCPDRGASRAKTQNGAKVKSA